MENDQGLNKLFMFIGIAFLIWMMIGVFSSCSTKQVCKRTCIPNEDECKLVCRNSEEWL